MSRWKTITESDLRAAGHGSILDAARAVPGVTEDPVTQAILKATAKVRRAVSVGGLIDVDETKIPASLEEEAVLLALVPLYFLIGLEMSKDLADAVRAARDELKRIGDKDKPVAMEPPDAPADSTTVPVKPGVETQQAGLTGDSREELAGL